MRRLMRLGLSVPASGQPWRGVAAVCAAALLTSAVPGCYAQRPLPRDASYRPASWEPVMGVITIDEERVIFDEPATLEAGRVVGRVDGSRYVAEPAEIRRLLVGRRTLDKPRTIVFGAMLIAVFTAFFLNIGID